MVPSKYTKRQEIESLDMEGLPPTFFQSASDMLEEGRGISKLRNRNDKIHAELHDLANSYNGCKLTSYKVENGDYIVHHVAGLNISVKLVNK